LTVKDIMGQLKNGPLHAESGVRRRPCASHTVCPAAGVGPPVRRCSARTLDDGGLSGLSRASSPARRAYSQAATTPSRGCAKRSTGSSPPPRRLSSTRRPKGSGRRGRCAAVPTVCTGAMPGWMIVDSSENLFF
jgi:hypothetical protein